MVIMNINDIRKTVLKVDGYLSDKEGELLYNIAKNCTGRGAIVEVGSWKGKSTIWIASGSKDGKNIRIYAIDPHTGSSEHKEKYRNIWTFEEFKNNIRNANVEDVVTPLVKTSEDAARGFSGPVEFVFIDGAHEYDFVKTDFVSWFPKIIDGGFLAFHDSGMDGPRKVIEDFVYKSRNFRNIVTADSITVAQKVGKNSITDRIKNRYYFHMKNMSEFASRHYLPKPVKRIGRNIFVPRPRFS
jgi:predicted O-methyltransferase YrrM